MRNIVFLLSMAAMGQVTDTVGIQVREGASWGRLEVAAFGPQSRWVAVSVNPGLVDLYDAGTKQKVRSFAVDASAFSVWLAAHPVRDLLAVGTNRSVMVFDVKEGRKLWEQALGGAEGSFLRGVLQLAVPEVGSSVVACIADGEGTAQSARVERFDLETGRRTRTDIVGAYCLLHPSGKWATMMVSRTGGRVYDLERGQVVAPDVEGVAMVAGKDGRRLIEVRSSGQGWRLMDAATRRIIAEGKEGFAMPLGEGPYVVAGSQDVANLRLLDVDTGRVLGPAPGLLLPAQGSMRMAAIDREGRRAAFLENGVLQVVAIEPSSAVPAGRVTAANEVASALPTTVALAGSSPDSRWLYVRSLDNYVDRWDTATGNRAPVRIAIPEGTTSIVFGRDGRSMAAVGTVDKVYESAAARRMPAGAPMWKTPVTRFDLSTGQPIPGGTFESAQALGSQSGYLMETKSESRVTRRGLSDLKLVLTVREAASGKVEGSVSIPDVFLGGSSAVNSDGSRLAVAVTPFPSKKKPLRYGSEMHVFDLRNGTKLVSFAPGAELNAQAMLLSPDGSMVAMGSGALGGPIRRFDVAAGREIAPIAGSEMRLPYAISPDGRLLLASAPMSATGLGGTSTVYELGSGRMVTQLESTGFQSARFLPGGKAVIQPVGDGVAVLSLETGKELGRLRALGNGDWLVTTAEGLFDGTPGGWNTVHWVDRGSSEALAGEMYFNEYFRPGLLAELLRGTRVAPARVITSVDRRQPEVRVRAVGKDARVARVQVGVREIRGGADGSGVRDVRLFRNGSLVRKWSGAVVLDAEGAADLEADVALVAGENKLTAYAFNRDNIRSAEAAAVVVGDESLRRKPTLRVVAVGINRYSNSAFDLRYAVADARAFAAAVKEKAEERGEYERVEVKVLEDGGATKAAAMDALRGIREASKPEDAVIVFFAGHGFAYGDRFVMAAHDLGYDGAAAGMREALPSLVKRGVTDLDLEEALVGMDAGRVMLVIDSCQSGQLLESDDSRRGPMNSRGLAQLAYEKGMLVLAAAQAQQAALETSRLGHGYLTYALVEEGLKGGKADTLPRDGQVSALEWLQYAAMRVPQMQDEELRKAEGDGRKLSFQIGVAGESKGLQTPRLFYRNDLDGAKWVVAGPK
ncbi:MAG: caspase family protein [Bryobacterales bacterium]|nr:caspase family protein [Bryobacterales bacterium]